MPALTESRPWGNLSIDAQCGRIRRIGVGEVSVSCVCRSPPGFAWSNTQSGEPDAGYQLPPRVNHGGTHRLTLGLASPGVAVWVGDTLLWGNPSGEASPCRPSRAPLRCDPDRRPSQTAPSGCSDLPYISFVTSGGSCARGSAVGGGTHVSSGGGSTPPNAAVGARWCSMHVRFVTTF